MLYLINTLYVWQAQTSNGLSDRDVNVVGDLSNVKVPPAVTFHPDKHCGVWLIVEKRRCLRSLTCKLHSILLKRKVEGRSRFVALASTALISY